MDEFNKYCKKVAIEEIILVVVCTVSIALLMIFNISIGKHKEHIDSLYVQNESIHKSYIEELEKVDQLEKQIKELELQRFKNQFEYAGAIYDVDPILLEAIERHETGNYKSENFVNKNNSWGAYDSKNKEYLSYDSHEQSTIELARTLRFHYFDEGLDTVEKIAKKYCPSDVEEWVNDVTAIYEQLGEKYEGNIGN